jgi:opacity protein-like surface antigen
MKRLFLAALALTALAAPAAAQQAHREGWWVEASGGYGYLRVGTQSQQVRRQVGVSGYLRGGRQLGRNVSLGLELSAYTGDTDTVTTHVGGLHAIAVFNPWGNIPLFLSGGVGVSDGRVQVGLPVNQVYEAKGTGVGLDFGAAYDIRVGQRFAITPSVSAHISALGDFIFSPTQKADDVIATVYQVGVGITWR